MNRNELGQYLEIIKTVLLNSAVKIHKWREKLTYVYQDKSSGVKAINKHFPDGLPDSILVTDRHGSYFNMEVKNYQVCIAHLLRNIQYLSELDPAQNWSARVATLLTKAIHIRKTTSFEAIPLAAIKERLDRLLEKRAYVFQDHNR